MSSAEFRITELEADKKLLIEALRRLMPIAIACKHENFSDLEGNEDTRSAAIRNAILVLRGAQGSTLAAPSNPLIPALHEKPIYKNPEPLQVINEPCPTVRNGFPCRLTRGHKSEHVFGGNE